MLLAPAGSPFAPTQIAPSHSMESFECGRICQVIRICHHTAASRSTILVDLPFADN
jgi:hypothetical protein